MAPTSFDGNNYGLQIAENQGEINAEFYLPPERPETPPSPLSTVPFPRDPDFVSRSTLLEWIHKKSSEPGSRIALVGLGGVGKSQLAIEFSYQVRSESPTAWVFWVHTSNQARFEQSFRDIADEVKIPGRQDPKVSIFKLVENWLRDEKRGRWICILDNADDDKFLCSVLAGGKGNSAAESLNIATKPLLEYIPRSNNGSIIITSRSKEIASKMVDPRDLIEVRPMEKAEALELLQRKLDQAESLEGQQLVEVLEFMPLAIVQAASYIVNRMPRYSVLQYLKDFQGSDREAIKLLTKDAGYLSRDWEASNSILVTWQISFDYIRRTTPSAAELLSLMSFFDRQGIPENLIRPRTETSEVSNTQLLGDSSDGETTESDETPEFEDDIMTLRSYSLISISENSASFTMHRLVQLTMRVWLKAYGQLDQWREKFINNLFQEFPTRKYKNWEKCRSIFPHIRSAMSQRPKSQESLLRWATLLYRGAWYASHNGNFIGTREMALESRKQRVRLLGAESEESLSSTAMLARAFSLGGLWEEAERLEIQVMETRKKTLGVDHSATLRSINNLALTFSKQGRWEEAEQLFVQVMETRMTKLGVDYPSTLTSMANLASTYRKQGRWEEAEQLEIQVMETRKKILGVDHSSTLTSMANLASTYRKQGRWEEAEQLEIQVLETSKTKLGVDHPDTLASMANLASTYSNQGRWVEAEQLGVQVIETSKTKLGVDHPDTLTSIANLALTYSYQGRWGEAEQLEVQVMETSKTKLGVDHPDTLTSMANLASTYRHQGRWKEAEQLGVQVLETRKTKLGVDHPDTLTSMANLAFTWRYAGRKLQALDLLRDCLAKQNRIMGSNHYETLSNSATLVEWETEDLHINT